MYIISKNKSDNFDKDYNNINSYNINSNINFNNTISKEKNIDQNKFNEVSKLIENSKPVIIVGKGCNNYYKELRHFAKLSNIPVTTTIHAMGCFDETKDLSLNFLGMHGNVAANYAVQNADLIINLGSRFDDRITGNTLDLDLKLMKHLKKIEVVLFMLI